jgi:hypothetical protein
MPESCFELFILCIANHSQQYLGPLIVIEQNFGGAYIICELNRFVFHRPVAAFRLLPYLARKSIPLPPNFLDIDLECLEALQKTSDVDEDIDEDFPDPKDY